MTYHIKVTDRLHENEKLMEENTLRLQSAPSDTMENPKLSLEGKKIQEKTRKILSLANVKKKKTRCLLKVLKEKLDQVLAINKLLPEPLKVSDEYFQLDERINNSFIKEELSKMNKLKSKLEFDYKKSLLGLQNVKNYFIANILTNKVEVRAILTDVSVKTIYEVQPNIIFISLINEFISKKHPKRRRREMTTLSKPPPSAVFGVTKSQLFLRKVLEKYSSLPKKIQYAIDKFAARNKYEKQQILNIQNMNLNKPSDENNIEEDALLENTLDSIGYFNLKSASDFKINENKIVLMEDTFDYYMEVRNKIHVMKKTFNKKVFELRTRKIKLIHEYKQFKFDISMIQQELNDPEIITPPVFPEVITDESIDPSLIDLFEPIDRWDPMGLFLNPEKSHLYDNENFYEEPTRQEIIMQKIRIARLKHRHMHFHETMLTKINMFDDYVLKLNRMRIDVELEIVLLNLWTLSLEEEMLVLYDFDLLEDVLSYNIHVKTGVQNQKAQEILRMQEEISYFNVINVKESNLLIDNQHDFDMCMKQENRGFTKQLKKIFDKKLKIPKVKSNDDDDNSSSSSDGSDESESDYNNESGESSMAMTRVPASLDEKVIQLGCDPKLFNTVLELRSKKYEIEQLIEVNKKKIDATNTHLNMSYGELNVIEHELKQIINELEASQIKKQLKLNDVYTTIVLNKSQMVKAKSLKNSILLYGNIIQDLSNRVLELKKEEKKIISTLKIEKLSANKDRIEIVKMENVLKNIKIGIKDEMKKKFKNETNWKFIDEMEMSIIDYMIIKSKTQGKDTRERYIKELRILENKISSERELATDIIRTNFRKNKLLKNILENIYKKRQFLDMDQERITTKFQKMSMESTLNTEITILNCQYKKLLEKKQDICEQINNYKIKCKVLPPMVQESSRKAIQSQAIKDKSSATPAT